MLSSKRIAELAVKFRFGTISPVEQEDLDNWLAGLTKANRRQFFEWVQSEEQTLEALKYMAEADASFDRNLAVFLNKSRATIRPRKVFHFRWIYAAAALVLLMVGGLYWYNSLPPRHTIAATLKPADIPPGGDNATLLLADGSSVDLTRAGVGAIGNKDNIRIAKESAGQVTFNPGNTPVNSSFNTIRTQRGGKYMIVLPDNTKAWLNAASSLRFPTAFNGSTREVDMEGEVYFEVAKNRSKPFLVHCRSNTIEVLGTHFNSMAYQEEEAMQTTLLEGSVKVTDGGQTVTIKPGQAAITRNGLLTVNPDADLESAIAWKNGQFSFNRADIKTVMNALARWYDVDVKYEGNGGLQPSHIDAVVDRNTSLQTMLNALKTSGFNFRVEGKTIMVSAK